MRMIRNTAALLLALAASSALDAQSVTTYYARTVLTGLPTSARHTCASWYAAQTTVNGVVSATATVTGAHVSTLEAAASAFCTGQPGKVAACTVRLNPDATWTASAYSYAGGYVGTYAVMYATPCT